MRTVNVIVPDSFEALTPEQLGHMLSQGKALAKLFKSAEEYAKIRLKSGQPVAGWKMAPGNRSRVWKSDEHAKSALAAQGINDPYKPQEILSVAEAEKKVLDPNTLKAAWDWVEGPLTLKEADIPAVLATPARPPLGF